MKEMVGKRAVFPGEKKLLQEFLFRGKRKKPPHKGGGKESRKRFLSEFPTVRKTLG